MSKIKAVSEQELTAHVGEARARLIKNYVGTKKGGLASFSLFLPLTKSSIPRGYASSLVTVI